MVNEFVVHYINIAYNHCHAEYAEIDITSPGVQLIPCGTANSVGLISVAARSS